MMAFKNLFRRKLRSLLTLIGIAIGVAAIVALRNVADGLISGYTGVFTGSGAHLVLTQANSSESSGSIALGAMEAKIGQALTEVPQVQDAAGVIITFTPLSGSPYFVILGYDPTQFAMQHFEIVEGTGLSPTASSPQEKVLILGKRSAENLKKKVGESLKVFDDEYRIVGIYETGIALEDAGAVVSLMEAQSMTNQREQVTAYLVRVQNLDELEATRQQIESRFPGLSVSLTTEVVNKMGGLETIRAFAWGISVIAVLVGGVGMMNTVIMSVSERMREIGTLRSLGWRKRRVFALVLQESLMLSLLGSLVGIGLGVLLVQIVSSIAAVSSLSAVNLTFELVLQVLVIGLGLGTVAGLFPAWWASRLMPLEALRYEESASATSRMPGPSALLGGLVLRNLWRSRARSLFTIVGTAVGVFAVVGMGAFAEGLTATFASLATDADLMVVKANISDMEFSTIDEEAGTLLAAVPGVKHVSGGLSGPVALEGASFFSLQGRGLMDSSLLHYRVVEGVGLSGEQQILLGKKAATCLGKKIGDVVKILDRSYSVVGLYETGDALEEFGGVVALSEAQALFAKPAQVGFFALEVQDPSQAADVRHRIEESFPGLSVTEAGSFAESLPDIQLTRGGTLAVTLLAAVVGAVGLMNTMIMSVFERTRQIGLLRTLGWRRWRILAMILGESLVLTFTGGVVGIALGAGLVQLFALSPETASIAMQLTPLVLIQGVGVAVVLGVLGGLFPAWRTMQLAPVEALRYE